MQPDTRPGTGIPTLALAMGDPAGISPELTAKLLALPDVRAAASLVVIGDRRVLAAGAEVAGIDPDVDVRRDLTDLASRGRPVFVDLGHLDPAGVTRGVAAREGGAFALANFRIALELAAAGRAHGVCFTPFNKAAMRAAHPSYDDEIGFSTERPRHDRARERVQHPRGNLERARHLARAARQRRRTHHPRRRAARDKADRQHHA